MPGFTDKSNEVSTTGGSGGISGAGTGWIGLGVQALGTAANIYYQNKMNKEMQRWNEEQYGVQRNDALDDWYRNASYNSPQAQMERFKAAGLNTNLIYGNGAAAGDAPVTRGTDIKAWNPSTPDYSKMSGDLLGAYQNYALMDEQVRNMQQQRKNMEVDNQLKIMDIATKGIKNAQGEFDLQQSRDLKDTVIAKADAQVRSIEAGTDIKISKEVRDAAMHEPNLAAAFNKVAESELKLTKSTQEIGLIREQIKKLQNEGVLQSMEIAMRKLGLSYNDGVILRMLAQFAGGKSLPEVVKNGWDMIQKFAEGASSKFKDVVETK